MTRPATVADAAAICGIYNHYVLGTTVSFEEETVSVEEMAGRMARVAGAHPWLVFEEGGEVLGYAYASRWKERSAYRHSVETTVYVKDGCHGKGMGTALYRELLGILRKDGFHAAMAGIALPNEKSQGLHEKLGFRKVAEFLETGSKFGKWINVGYWEYLF